MLIRRVLTATRPTLTATSWPPTTISSPAIEILLRGGGNQRAHDRSRDIRERASSSRGRTAHQRDDTAHQRDETARARFDIADQRDAAAHARDVAAWERDQAARARDLAIGRRDAAEGHGPPRAVTGAEIVMRAAAQRTRAAQHRAQAGEHRAQAAEDRHAAALDREQAARDRRHALDDREKLASELAISETDPLTGARTRAAGLTDLDHELDRCRRTGSSLVVAYVDVVGLKTLNDTKGHSAGDELLQRVVAFISEHTRPYDLIIRVGGDEFLGAMSNLTLRGARERFGAVADALAASVEAGAISVGFAELRPDEVAAELIARADGELLDSRSGHHAQRR